MKTSLSTSTSFLHLKRAFTLIELLVVIGILGILMGILVTTLGGSQDSAKAVKCLANMRNLAMAVQACGTATAHFPHAGSIEKMNMDVSEGKRNSRLVYNEVRGWISWASEGKYPAQSKGGCPEISFMTSDEDLAKLAITNGALWRYVGGDRSVYTCPLHANKNKQAKWSYFMNAFFGWNASEGFAYGPRHAGIEYQNLRDSDKILLFAEIPFQGPGDWFPSGEGASDETDCILQYKGCNKGGATSGPKRRDGNEHIGCNHKIGKTWYAHVVYADGHTEKFACNQGKSAPLGSNELRELTTWLCQGKAVTFKGNRYEELK